MRQQGDIYLDCGEICNRMKGGSRCVDKMEKGKCPAKERMEKKVEMAAIIQCISKRSGKSNALVL